jgi:hypothetical protein
MNFMTTIVLFIVLGFFSFILDIKTAPKDFYASCDTHFPILVLLIHHIIFVFNVLGWLSYNKYILYLYVFSILIHFILWVIFKDKCILTIYVNEKCKNHTKLRNIVLFTTEKLNLDLNRNIQKIIYSLTTAYVVYKLTTKKLS